MGCLGRLIIRVFALLLVFILTFFGIDAIMHGRNLAAYGLWAIALLLVASIGRKKSVMSWRNDPATYRQMSFADDLGIKYRRGATKGELSDLISKKTGK